MVPTSRTGHGPWLSLTELGREYGISAVHTGKLLAAAGLRRAGGEPSAEAIRTGLAQRQHPGHHHQALWNRDACAPHLEGQGLQPHRQRRLVGLWADLLSTLQQGCPWISVSAEEMAVEIPSELVQPVNRELQQRGCAFQVAPAATGQPPHPQDSRSASACLLARSSS